MYFGLPIDILQGILSGKSHIEINVSQMCVVPMGTGSSRMEV